MRKVFLVICCAAAIFPVIGCSGPKEGTVATTDQDEIDAYNAMLNDPQGPGEDDDSADE